jgi:hypothetical protein
MQVENTLIVHPTSTQQLAVVKAFFKALKIKFEVTTNEKPYNDTFVNMVLEAEKEINTGKGLKLNSEEFDNLWK